MLEVKNFFKTIVLFFLTCLTFVGVFSPPVKGSRVSATTSSVMSFEQSNVLDDLTASTINGKEFDLRDYSFDEEKDIRVISFVEYCYSFDSSKQSNYGLYVYVYNPKGLLINTASPLNTIQFAVGDSEDSSYQKYKLKFLNRSNQVDYEGLFYKFKVTINSQERARILKVLNSTERVYQVSSIEIITTGETNAVDYPVEKKYLYSGYAAGYGNNESAESTLKCSAEDKEVLSLEVRSTFYRPEGTNGKNKYTQDSLHSVYFAVPNEIIENYGIMSAVHATWLNAVLAPALVTGNYSAYQEVSKFLGKSLPENNGRYHTDELSYVFYGDMDAELSLNNTKFGDYGYGYNTVKEIFFGGFFITTSPSAEISREINPLYTAFYAGGGTDSADNYIVSSEDIKSRLEQSADRYGGELVNGKYSKVMFDHVDEEFTEVNIRADEQYSLTNQTITQNWWQKIWGTETVYSTSFDGIQAIYPVEETDLSGTEGEIAQRLYIADSDVEDFKEFYESSKENDETVYLFRYRTSDYVSQETTTYKYSTYDLFGATQYEASEEDTNAYFFQQAVDLDFDIIDVTFSNGEKDTVIPVVSNPIDVVHEGTPPVYTESDETPDWLKWLMIILGAVALLAVLWLLSIILPIVKVFDAIIKILAKIIAFPFKLLARLFGKGKKGTSHKKERKK